MVRHFARIFCAWPPLSVRDDSRGIFRPVGMTGLLSIKTVVPNPKKGRIWYHDQSSPDLSPGSDVFLVRIYRC